MPRGVKGSGKASKPAGESGQPRRRGRKPKGLRPEAAKPMESATIESPTISPPLTKDAPLQAMPARPAQAPELAAIEASLVQRYPQQKIKRGSLLPSGATAEFGKKRSVIIICQDCGIERRIATSDLFQVSRCRSCTSSPKRAAKKATKQERTQQYSLTAAWRHPDEGSDYWFCVLTNAEAAVVRDAIGWLRNHAGREYGKSLPRWTIKATAFQAEAPLVGQDATLAVLIEVSHYGRVEYGATCPVFAAHLQVRTEAK